MSNLRTFYACQAVAVAPVIPNADGVTFSSGTYNYIRGAQSVGLNSSFDTENLFELGQLEIYDAVLNLPQIEITIEKILDGYKTVYGLLASGQPLVQASKHRANVQFALFPDTSNAVSNGAIKIVECTGMYINSVTYTFPVDGNITESVTLVGNHKQWYIGPSGAELNTNGSPTMSTSFGVPTAIANGTGIPDDNPRSVTSLNPYASGILRRQNIVFRGPGQEKAQSVTFTLNLNREDIFEFGKRIPYAKIATYPIEATVEVQSLAVSGSYDDISFNENTTVVPQKNVGLEVEVKVSGADGVGAFLINTGSGNFLTAINHTGGDAGGGNATVTRNYTAYNVFNIVDSGMAS